MLNFSKKSRVLVVAPHADDEVHCGGTIKKFSKMGCEIAYVSFSFCAASLPGGFSEEDIKEENSKSLDILGVEDELRFNFDFNVRHFDAYRQDILEELVLLRNRFQPTVVLCPSMDDSHQDHVVVHNECERAFRRNVTLLGYMHPLNSRAIFPNFFAMLKHDEWIAKLESWNAYESQRHKPTPFTCTWLDTVCKMWGSLGFGVGNHAEAFHALRCCT